MKNFLIFLFLILFSLVSAQENNDSLLKKAELGIYDNPDLSIKIANQLLEKEKNPEKLSSIYIVKSNAYIAKRDYDASLKNTLLAKSYMSETKDPDKKIKMLISIAIQYQQMEIYNKSLETLDEAELLINKNNSAEKHLQLAKCLAIKGMIYKSQGNMEIALQKLLQSIQNFQKSPPTNAVLANMSVVNYNIGYCYLNLDNTQNAENYFLKSKKLAQKISANSLQAFALKGEADCATKNGNYQQAITLLLDAEKLSGTIGDLVLNEGIYNGLSQNYLLLNDVQNYKIYNEKYKKTKLNKEHNELMSINRSIDSHRAESRIETKLIQKKYKIIMVLIVIATSILVFILVHFILRKKKLNQNFTNKIKEILQS